MTKSRAYKIKPTALIVAGICTSCFLVLAILVKNDVLTNLNQQIYDAIASLINPPLTGAMIATSFWGEWYVWLSLAIILCWPAKTRTNFGWPLLFATLVAGALAVFTKDVFRIARPHIHWLVQEVGYSFPSGHVTISTAFVTTFLYFFLCSRTKKPWKVLIATLAILWVLLIGFSRIYLGVHNLTDVMGGYLVGISVAAAVIFAKETYQIKVCGK